MGWKTDPSSFLPGTGIKRPLGICVLVPVIVSQSPLCSHFTMTSDDKARRKESFSGIGQQHDHGVHAFTLVRLKLYFNFGNEGKL